MVASGTPDAEQLMEYLYHASLGVVRIDLAGQIRLLNPIAVRLLMPLASGGDLLQNLYVTLESLLPDLRKIVESAPDRKGNVLKNCRIALPNGVRGHAEPMFISLSVVRVDHDSLIVTIEDISEAVRHERLLSKQEAWINAVLSGASRHGQLLLDHDGRIRSWNASMQQLTGFADAELMGQPYSTLFAADAMTADRMSDRLDEVNQTGLSFAEGRMRRADDSGFWGHSVLMQVDASLGSDGYILLIRDISDHRETVDSLLKAATSDQLTGVANRRALYEAAEIEFSRHARKPRAISLLLLDIDHFKQVNDTCGHPFGDQVIRNLATVLLKSVRTIDIVARIGGEEFVVLLPSTDMTMAVRIAERIRSNVAEERMNFGQHAIDYRVSIGVASVTGDINGIDDLLTVADSALYDAKRGGRDRVCKAG